MKHPIQPVFTEEDGTLRFKANEIVRFLLDAGPFDMNQLACMDFPREDREQFAQLIGYSVGGFGELSYASNEVYDAAWRVGAEGANPEQARIQVLSDRLDKVRAALRTIVPELFQIHEDDLIEE